MSEYILFYYYFNKQGSSIFSLIKTGGDWKSSAIRKLLNDKFYNTAFSTEEKSKILQSTVDVETSNLSLAEKIFSTDSYDYVFILSKTECENLGLTKSDLSRHQTDFGGPFIDCSNDTPSVTFTPWMTRTASGLIEQDKVCTYVVAGNGTVSTIETAVVGIAPVIRVREEDVTVHSDDALQTLCQDNSEAKNADNISAANQNKQVKPQMTLKDRILYTVLAPVFLFAGLILGSVCTGAATTGNIGGFIAIGYMVFSEVMVWKLKTKRTVLIIVLFNFVVAFVSWLVLGR